MRRVLRANINTGSYWDSCYAEEQASGKQRVDDVRMSELRRWVQVREEEVGRKIELLDVGCGLGDVARSMRGGGVRVHGIDISEHAIEHCRATVQGATFAVGSAEQLAAGRETYDVVWIGETLEHCDEPDQVIRGAARVCGELGFVVISTPYRGRNRSPEHVWEFEPDDVARWAHMVGELVFLDCKILPAWETMFAVMRRAHRSTPS